ncbi:MAG: hypothetical protein ACE5FM_04635, partial [Methyloligellaceae bacterium]
MMQERNILDIVAGRASHLRHADPAGKFRKRKSPKSERHERGFVKRGCLGDDILGVVAPASGSAHGWGVVLPSNPNAYLYHSNDRASAEAYAENLRQAGIKAQVRQEYIHGADVIGRWSVTYRGNINPEQAYTQSHNTLATFVRVYERERAKSVNPALTAQYDAAIGIVYAGIDRLEKHRRKRRLGHGVSKWGVAFDVLARSDDLSLDYQEIARVTLEEADKALPPKNRVATEVAEALPEPRPKTNWREKLFGEPPDIGKEIAKLIAVVVGGVAVLMLAGGASAR